MLTKNITLNAMLLSFMVSAIHSTDNKPKINTFLKARTIRILELFDDSQPIHFDKTNPFMAGVMDEWRTMADNEAKKHCTIRKNHIIEGYRNAYRQLMTRKLFLSGAFDIMSWSKNDEVILWLKNDKIISWLKNKTDQKIN